MSSPRPTDASTQPQTQPLTPPAEPSPQNPSAANNTTTHTATSTTAATNPLSSQPLPLTSLKDTGTSKRPRDTRLIHLLLASQGVSAYQERVPLQLLDFAYRYTSSIIQDALHLQAEGYDQAEAGGSGGGGKGRGQKIGEHNMDTISLTSLRMAVGSRAQYQFQQGVPKESLLELAGKRNGVGLPGVVRGGAGGVAGGTKDTAGVMLAGVRLPHERYCLTGTGWGLKEAWDSEGEEDVDDEDVEMNGGDVTGNGMEEDEGEEGEEEQAEREAMEGLLGGGGGDKGDNEREEEGDGDEEMGDG